VFEEAFISWAKTSESKPGCVIIVPMAKSKGVYRPKNVLSFFIKFGLYLLYLNQAINVQT
jgi:hypothetical protein